MSTVIQKNIAGEVERGIEEGRKEEVG